MNVQMISHAPMYLPVNMEMISHTSMYLDPSDLMHAVHVCGRIVALKKTFMANFFVTPSVKPVGCSSCVPHASHSSAKRLGADGESHNCMLQLQWGMDFELLAS